jgi:hypothetical protein
MTTPSFLATDETACDDDRALTAEHGRRIVRNALAIWNERCGHVGHAEMMTQPNGDDVTTRAIITAGWAYVGPMHYFCPAPVGTPNASRPNPTITLYLVGRATGSATSYVYAINENVGAPATVSPAAPNPDPAPVAARDVTALPRAVAKALALVAQRQPA